MVKPQHSPWLLLALGAFFFLPLPGNVHLFDGSEAGFLDSARTMLRTGTYLPVPNSSESIRATPPLFVWFQVVAMYLFGDNEFAARYPNAVAGIVTLLLLYRIGNNLHGSRFGLLWAVGYLGSLLPHLYMKTGLAEPCFNQYIFLSICYLFTTTQRDDKPTAWVAAALAGLFVGLAILIKGPVGLLVVGSTYLLVWGLGRFQPIIRLSHLLLGIGLMVAVSAIWIGPLLASANTTAWVFNLVGSASASPSYYPLLLVVLGGFPTSVFAIRYLWSRADPTDFRLWMVGLFWVGLLLSMVAPGRTIHDASLTWIPLTYLATRHLADLLTNRVAWTRWLTAGLLLVGGGVGALLIALPLVGTLREVISIKVAGAPLGWLIDARWQGWEWLIGATYLVVPLAALVKLSGCVQNRRIRSEKVLPGPIWILFLSAAGCLWLYWALVQPGLS